MNFAYREGVKEQLRAMAAGRGDGIDLDSKNRWVIEGLENPTNFFRQIHLVVPQDGILYFEGCQMAKEAQDLYQKHRAPNAVPIVRDTIFPVPDTFHVVLTSEFVLALCELLIRYDVASCFYHVKAYRNERLLLAFHDAFDGSDCLLSDLVPESDIQSFASSLGNKYRLEPNVNKRDPDQLLKILWAMENPKKLKMNWPWWKKAFFFWKK